MTKFYWLIAVSIAAVGCGEVNKVTPGADSCKVACTTDADCMNGQTCGELGLCADPGDTCTCNANEFIACNGETKVSCNAAGNGIAMEACGSVGCNETNKQCNACVASTDSCSSDMTKLEHCGPDGVLASSDTCGAGCVNGTNGAACGHIKPEWLPGVCTTPATVASVTVTALDTSQDAQCTGGAFSLDGTEFCAIRAGTINIGDLRVTGPRAVAFVADDAVNVTGILDVSADATTSGPGGGAPGFGGNTIQSGVQGAGGGGFVQTGGPGGSGDTGSPAGSPGGVITPRATTTRFMGGSRGGNSICGNGISTVCFNNVDFTGGGAGGGALLIACRGKVTVSTTGVIDAGGGGAAGGGDHATTINSLAQGGAPGGGSGGYVVFQGVTVELLGKFYANGGGGGGACGTDQCRGPVGMDGLRSLAGAPGGDAPGNTCGGGIGGSVSNAPGPGENTFSSAAAGAGGGGGSMGRFEVFTPAGHTPAISPLQASPAPVAATSSLTIE